MGATTMKRGTTPTFRVRLNYDDLSVFASVDFLFKQSNTEAENVPKILKTYPSDDVQLVDGAYEISFSEAESRTFAPDSVVYLDVRPTTVSGSIPRTPMSTIRVAPTLYKEAALVDDNNGGEGGA